MLQWTKFNSFKEYLNKGKIDWSTHTFKIEFLGAPALSTNSVKADLTEISAGGGYSSGGVTVNVLSVSQSGGVTSVMVAAASLTTSGSVGPVYGLALYDDSATGDPLICYCNFAAPITIPTSTTWSLGLETSNAFYTDE